MVQKVVKKWFKSGPKGGPEGVPDSLFRGAKAYWGLDGVILGSQKWSKSGAKVVQKWCKSGPKVVKKW